MPSLLNIPDIAMLNVLEYTSYKDIFRVRRVCKNLKNFIDQSKPDIKIKQLKIAYDQGTIHLKINEKEKFEQKAQLIYIENKQGCDVRKVRFVPGVGYETDYVTALLMHLKRILSHQKSPLDNFEVSYSNILRKSDMKLDGYLRILEFLHDNLKSRRLLMAVQNLCLTVAEEENVMQILPYLNPKSIKELELKSVFFTSHWAGKKPINMAKVVQLPQWKNLKTLLMHDFQIFDIFSKAESFGHILRGNVHFSTIDAADILELKEKISIAPRQPELSSVTFNVCHTTISNSHLLINHYGLPQGTFGAEYWSFELPHSTLSMTRRRTETSFFTTYNAPPNYVILN